MRFCLVRYFIEKNVMTLFISLLPGGSSIFEKNTRRTKAESCTNIQEKS